MASEQINTPIPPNPGVDKSSNLYRFRAWVQKTLPAVYDDSLSYIEMFSKVVQKLNEVINSQNTVIDGFNELIDAYNELYNWVDAYFNNLDVQHEVNIKLDQMAGDGTLSELLDAAMQGDITAINNSIAQIKTDISLINSRLNAIGNPAQGTKFVDPYGVEWNTVSDYLASEVLDTNIHKIAANVSVTPENILSLQSQNKTIGYIGYLVKIPTTGIDAVFIKDSLTIDGAPSNVHPAYTILEFDGENYSIDTENSAIWCPKAYSSYSLNIPYIENRYLYIGIGSVLDNVNKITPENAQNVITENGSRIFDLYYGHHSEGISLPQKYTTLIAYKGYNVRFNPLASTASMNSVAFIVPCDGVNGVACDPGFSLYAEISKYDRATKASSIVYQTPFETFESFNTINCNFVDLSAYNEDYFALIVLAKKLNMKEINDKGHNESSAATTENMRNNVFFNMSFDAFSHVKISLDKCKTNYMINGTDPFVISNIELVKSLKVDRPHSNYGANFIPGSDDASGILYGSQKYFGSFFYNVSPATYAAMLCNPNSHAYDETIDYGLVCSEFSSMVTGIPIPLSTFSYRYNPVAAKYCDVEPFNFYSEMYKMAGCNTIIQGAKQTGHCIVPTMIGELNGLLFMEAAEATTPMLNCSGFYFQNGPRWNNKNINGDWMNEAYDFVSHTKPGVSHDISKDANWVPYYTEPQKVMVNVGYNGVYAIGTGADTQSKRVELSLDTSIETFTLYKNGEIVANMGVAALNPVEKHGYNVVDITQTIMDNGEGRYVAEYETTMEQFYVIDVSDYSVTCTVVGDEVEVVSNSPTDIKYITAYYYALNENDDEPITRVIEAFPPTDGKHGTIPYEIIGYDDIVFRLGASKNAGNHGIGFFTNVVFKTEYDTNTIFCDGEGEKG